MFNWSVMRKSFFLSIVLMVIFSQLALAQAWKGTGKVGGSVVDEAGNPIAGVTVKMTHAQYQGGPTLTTDENGKWFVVGIRGGAWLIDYSMAGYKPYGISVEISNVRTGKPIEVVLEKAAAMAESGISEEQKEALSTADSLFQAGDYQAALDEYTTLKGTFPELTFIDLRIADCQAGLGDYDAAIAIADEILAKEPNNNAAYTTAGNAAFKKGDFETAYTYYKKLADAAPNDAGVQANFGQITMEIGNYEESQAAFSKAIELSPTAFDLYVSLSGVQMMLEDYAAAKATLEKLKADAPADHPIFQAWNIDELIAMCDAELQ